MTITEAKAARISDGKAAERRLGWYLCSPAAIFMLLVAGYPIVYSVILSFKRYDLRFPDQQGWVGFSNYATVLTNSFWWDTFGVTMLITVVSVAVELVLGMGLAVIMYRTLVAKGLLRTTVLIPYGIVTVVAAYAWFYAWTPGTGWLANLLPAGSAPLTQHWPAIGIIILAEIWKTTPFMGLLLLAGLATIPEELYRAASMDGAGRWQRFVKITLPLMKPAISVALLFRMLDAFRIYDNIYVLTKGAVGTSSVSILTYKNLVRGLNLGIGSTMSVLIFLTVAIIAFIFVRVLRTGAPGEGGRR
ncbi:MAG TPA: sugar ABC transporter permease [Stackebrandtia sp.]|uniref:carbohydrate ABC transporter permease n=1 Tax=Stackebrandtia sp. TaxID=2023065 RepID=UPI002D2D41A6|nr:sugar ABC transporter permease [Stackebrandtia sp.]HZE42074.1 sugar ABC transporter permease [Stackebrandtia sp.]